MATLNIKIDKKDYQLACADNEEEHLLQLCDELNARINALGKIIGTANHSLLLVAASVSLLDELKNLKANGASDESKKLAAQDATSEVFGEVVDRLEAATKELEAADA